MNGLILFLKYFQKNKREKLRRDFYPKDQQHGKKESGFVFFTAVLTSWISPCSIWTNNFCQKARFLLISSSTCIIVYFLHIITIGLFENLGFFFPTENPPITRCFKDVDKFNSSKYRIFWTENQTILDIFEICNNNTECQPAIRICSENEYPSDELCKVLIPIGLALLSLSFFASLVLEHLGNHYSFVKFLIRIGAIGTINFANAFNELRKSKQLLDENLKKELYKLMKNAVGHSNMEHDAVLQIFGILIKADLTEEDKKLLNTHLHLLGSTTNQGQVWKDPPMHSAVKGNNYIWFSLQILFGGECGAKNGQGISSINLLRNKIGSNINLLERYNFITRWLIKRALQKYQEFALHIAAEKGDLQKIKTLITYSYNVNLKDTENQTPLHIAAKNGHLEIVKFLVENGANKDSKSYKSRTPLHIASENGYLEIAKFLVENHADKESKDDFNQTPLHLAAKKGHLEIAKYLNKICANKEAKDVLNQAPLLLASEKGHFEIVKFLFEIGADKNAKNKYNQTPLHLAAEKGHFGIVIFLVENDSDKELKDRWDQTALHIAARNGNFEIVKYLVENHSDKESKDHQNQTALHIAAISGNLEIVHYLVEKHSDKESKGDNNQTPLHFASKIGHFEIIQFLIKNYADTDSKDQFNQTSLHYATIKGHLEIVKYLVEIGAAKEAKDKDCLTPLHWAAKLGH